MANQNVFKRYELKYLLTKSQYHSLQEVMQQHMKMDEYGLHTINNIYFDTPDFLLIRRSLEKPCYKEKLRVRSYGNTTDTSSVFVEMKKKYQGVVYKRRLVLAQKEAFDFLINGTPLHEETQITKELAYFMEHYHTLSPSISLHYEREAYYGLEDANFRMTFDQNIRVNDHLMTLENEREYTNVIPKDNILLEVKTNVGLPSWLLHFFSENHIFKTSFSKYGRAYQNHILTEPKGGKHYVA